jgi:superoxide reductase
MMKTAETTPNLFEQINHPKDMKNMTDIEKKHTPGIECPDTVEANKPFDITINIGIGMDHPSELAHFIEWISLGRDDTNMVMCEAVMQPKFTRPKAMFRIALDRDTTLVARESCNLHGIWENKKQITVR